MAGEYWKDRAPQAANLRLLCIKEGWKSFVDRLAADGKTVEEVGSASLVESALFNALNATSVLVLAGAGASLSAANPTNKTNAPTMYDLWLAVIQAVGEDAFGQVLAQFQYAAINGEIVRSRAEVGAPALIYPRSSKYQEAFEPPYLDMMGAFQAALREPDAALIISGFGFNDDHISRPVIAATEANLSLRLIVCDPTFIRSDEDLLADHHVVSDNTAPDNEFLARLHALAIAGDARIHLANGRFSDLAAALPDPIGETDRERHANRIRALRDVTGSTPR